MASLMLPDGTRLGGDDLARVRFAWSYIVAAHPAPVGGHPLPPTAHAR
jgi:hypothetical protein